MLSRFFILDEEVPQGSVFSVVLFAITIKNIVDSVPDTVKCSLYVDGLTLHVSVVSVPHLERQLN